MQGSTTCPRAAPPHTAPVDVGGLWKNIQNWERRLGSDESGWEHLPACRVGADWCPRPHSASLSLCPFMCFCLWPHAYCLVAYMQLHAGWPHTWYLSCFATKQRKFQKHLCSRFLAALSATYLMIHYIQFWHNLFHFSITYLPDLPTSSTSTTSTTRTEQTLNRAVSQFLRYVHSR